MVNSEYREPGSCGRSALGSTMESKFMRWRHHLVARDINAYGCTDRDFASLQSKKKKKLTLLNAR